MDFHPVESAFQDAVAQGVFPGAVVLVSKDGEIVFEQAFGSRSLIPEKTPLKASTIFDLASLTKPLATTIAIMILVREKKIRLDDQITRFIPMFGVFGKSTATFRQMLNHSSGLPAWKPFHEEIVKMEKAGRINFVASWAAKNFVYEQIHREKPVSAPGAQCLYSDLGFMILGESVEVLSGATIARFCQDRIFKPLGLRSTAFVDLTQLRTRRLQPVEDMIAPTENCPWRKKILCGEVHDDNAYAMGGVAGHAGLFSSARDVHALLACLNRCLHGKDDFLPKALLEEFLAKDEKVSNSTCALGWDTPSPDKSASGTHFSPRSVGHLGFTGTSIWWDIEKNCHIILLSNRVHPTRKNEKIKDFRPHVHDLIMKVMFP
ncbi:MAG: serine hydrolase domain-containing protein [Deltaproteobacteria bacterium]|nr:serine hydrolase domain-containing protein [Deltaproteobacteria bacterium]MDZ4341209.1 serine hydrolase domain-containing protein [Candidatus Binatia bacterium]